jgi:hypothetical protein
MPWLFGRRKAAVVFNAPQGGLFFRGLFGEKAKPEIKITRGG